MLVAALASLALAPLAFAQSPPVVNTPSAPTFCQPTLLSWSGGVAPYYLTINQGGSTSVVLQSLLSATTQTSYTWIADIPAGTSITVAIKDSTGADNFAQAVTIAANPSGLTTCASASSQAVSQSSQVAAAVSSSAASGASAASSAVVSSSAAASSAVVSSSRAASSAVVSASSSSVNRASSVASSASAGASSVLSSASRPLAAASSGAASASASVAPGSGAFATYGAPVLTTGLLAAGALAVALF